MPQTEVREGHAHRYEKGDLRTETTGDHWHPIRPNSRVTGPAVKIGALEAEPGAHFHTINNPSEGFHRS